MSNSNNTDNDNDSNETTNDLKDSEYYTETELTDFLKNKKISDRTHLKLLTLNIANLLSKQRSLKLLVENISNEANRPNIITITETHLNESRNQGYSDSELLSCTAAYSNFLGLSMHHFLITTKYIYIPVSPSILPSVRLKLLFFSLLRTMHGCISGLFFTHMHN